MDSNFKHKNSNGIYPSPFLKTFKKGEGFTMIELIVTIVLLSFGIIGIYSFFYPASILNSNFSLHLTAAYLASDGFEIVKNIRDNNILSGSSWSQGFNICNTGCDLDYKTKTSTETLPNQLKAYTNTFLKINSDGFYSYGPGTNSIFKRKVTITQPGLSADTLKVNVLITWNYNNKPFSFSTIGYIYNY